MWWVTEALIYVEEKNPALMLVLDLSLGEDLSHHNITCLGLLPLLLPPGLIFLP